MAGLIVTCARHFEPDACDEIERILGDLGDESAAAKATPMSGIIAVSTELDPGQIIKGMRELVDEEPWAVRYIMRAIPVLEWIESKEEEIIAGTLKMSEKFLPADGTYRISIEKRNSQLSSRDLITGIAEKIPNKVSLENPDHVVMIQILGSRTGISVMPEPAVLSVGKQKRLESD